MIVRPATNDDLPTLVEMARQFHAFAGFESLAPFCAGSTEETGRIIMEHGVFLVAEAAEGLVGMIGLMIAPVSHNHAFRQAVELMWWVNPGDRARGIATELIAEAEAQAKAKGASTIMMIHLSNSPESAARTYRSRGYGELETVYMKAI